MIGIVIAYMIATTASAIWQCNPISGAWDKSSNPTCISLTKNWYANAGYSIATDVIILLLPMQPIWSSKLPVNQKRALMLVFALGGLYVVSSGILIRTHHMTNACQRHHYLDSASNDAQLFYYKP